MDVTFRLADSMRLNRGGDRLSHLLATAIWHYFQTKYGVAEDLDFRTEAKNEKFDHSVKRQVVSKLSYLAEQAKEVLAQQGRWQLEAADEGELLGYLRVLQKAQVLCG